MATNTVLDFAQQGGYVEISYNSCFDLINNFTIEAWINPKRLTRGQRIFTKYSAYSFGLIRRQIRFTTYENQDYDAIQEKLSANTWYHLAVVLDGNNSALFYVNGELVETLPGSLPANKSSSSCAIGRGGNGQNFGENWYGQITEVRFWNSGRSQEEIQAQISSRLAGNEPGLVGYWPLNEGFGNKVSDRTPNANHGIIQGNATWAQSELPLSEGVQPVSEVSEWIELQPVRHQVAIYGQISDAETGLTIQGAVVEITQMPETFKKWLASRSKQYGNNWETMSDRPDRKRTATDGYFHFLDLPDGDYTFTASLPNAGTRYGTAQVTATASCDSIGNSVKTTASMTLPPTAIKGQITDAEGNPIVLAKIQIQGSADYIFSDSKGNYLFSGLETSKAPLKRRVNVNVSARGFQPASQSADLSQGEVQNLNFVLVAGSTNGK